MSPAPADPDPSDPDPSEAPFSYSNLAGRHPGRVLAIAGLFLPGITRVQRDVEPFAGAWQRANAAAVAGSGPLWVALGDSLTQGIGAPAYDRGWVGQLLPRLNRARPADRALAVVNLGVSGATTADVLARQVPALHALPLARIALVTLMIGSNDLMKPAVRGGLPGRMTELLDTLAAARDEAGEASGAAPAVVVTTLPNPSAVAGQANEAIRGNAERDGIVVAELRDPRTSSWRGRLAADHFHPNEDGYTALADVLADTVVPVLAGR